MKEFIKKQSTFITIWFRFLAAGDIGHLCGDSSFQQRRKGRKS